MEIKKALLTIACLTLISLTSGCATFNEMARQRGEAAACINAAAQLPHTLTMA